MQLLTKAQRDTMIQNHRKQEQDHGSHDFKPVVKLFNPTGRGTWHLSELDPETNIAFGLCEIFEKELGSVSLDEIASYRGPLGLGIERDRHFTPTQTLREMAGLR